MKSLNVKHSEKSLNLNVGSLGLSELKSNVDLGRKISARTEQISLVEIVDESVLQNGKEVLGL